MAKGRPADVAELLTLLARTLAEGFGATAVRVRIDVYEATAPLRLPIPRPARARRRGGGAAICGPARRVLLLQPGGAGCVRRFIDRGGTSADPASVHRLANALHCDYCTALKMLRRLGA